MNYIILFYFNTIKYSVHSYKFPHSESSKPSDATVVEYPIAKSESSGILFLDRRDVF